TGTQRGRPELAGLPAQPDARHAAVERRRGRAARADRIAGRGRLSRGLARGHRRTACRRRRASAGRTVRAPAVRAEVAAEPGAGGRRGTFAVGVPYAAAAPARAEG